jgi:hypothetical protein
MAKSQLQEAIQLAKSGQADSAVEILRRLVQTNPDDMIAWLWLAECTTDIDEARFAARKVLEIRPTNARAQKILLELGEGEKRDWFSFASKRSVQKNDEVPKPPPWKLFGLIGISVLALVLAFVFLTDFPHAGDNSSGELINPTSGEGVRVAQNDEGSFSDDAQPNNEADTASDTVAEDSPLDEEDVHPEELTVQWLNDVIEGRESADFSWGCDDRPSGLQGTLEPFLARVLEFGVRNTLRTIQLDAAFNLLSVIDDTAEYEIDGKIVVTIFGYKLESPEFKTVVRFAFDQGEWVVCEVGRR